MWRKKYRIKPGYFFLRSGHTFIESVLAQHGLSTLTKNDSIVLQNAGLGFYRLLAMVDQFTSRLDKLAKIKLRVTYLQYNSFSLLSVLNDLL